MSSGPDLSRRLDRRQFLRLAGFGGVAFCLCVDGPQQPRSGTGRLARRVVFVQLSDSHWGFDGPAVNPEAATTLPEQSGHVNALAVQPDFIVFTGDLTHTTDDPTERRRRLAQFKEIAGGLANKNVRFHGRRA